MVARENRGPIEERLQLGERFGLRRKPPDRATPNLHHIATAESRLNATLKEAFVPNPYIRPKVLPILRGEIGYRQSEIVWIS